DGPQPRRLPEHDDPLHRQPRLLVVAAVHCARRGADPHRRHLGRHRRRHGEHDAQLRQQGHPRRPVARPQGVRRQGRARLHHAHGPDVGERRRALRRVARRPGRLCRREPPPRRQG
ncbi:hypothetical protein BN1708_019375, partial [Verticillium longisporum]